ncbi:MAG: hypothetical protein IT239_02625 [Bacteroidia bacterium]|nr:hypothetical protein [Bacteroidia bacterium]
MKSNFSLRLFFIFFIGVNKWLYSQNTSLIIKRDSILNAIDSIKETTSSIEIGSEFLNKVVFWGRNFGEKQHGFENNILYKTKFGWYTNYTGYVWSAMPNRYAKTDLGLGYENQLTDNFYASLEYQRWIFNNGDYYVKNALANYLKAELSYNFGFINVEPCFYYMFGIEHIFQSDIEVNHEFILATVFKSGKVCFFPRVLSTFANQGFLPIYGKSPSGFIENNQFKCVDTELSLPLVFSIRNFETEATLNYNYPIKIGNEKLSPFFYFSISLNYNLFFSKGKIHQMYKSL